jgi:hypothetical protein
MNDRMRNLSDGELNIVSGGGGCKRIVTTINGVTDSGQPTYGTSVVPCAPGTYTEITIAEPGTMSSEIQDMMGGDPCD